MQGDKPNRLPRGDEATARYNNPDKDVRGARASGYLTARYEDETIWLTQRLMAELFAADVRTVSEHLENIFGSGELGEDVTMINRAEHQTRIETKLDSERLVAGG